uniref:hypothetical protein n=1 Tax=Salmonella sp. SAL4436 TaxID=3159891 RepID=UPI0039781AE2
DKKKMPGQNSFVLGTSAFLALPSGIRRGGGRGASFPGEKEPMPAVASFMSRMEVLYNVWREEGEEAACHAVDFSFAV